MSQQNFLSNNILLRILSGIIIGTVFIVSILWVRLAFYGILLLISIFMLLEWFSMTKTSFKDILIGFIAIPIAIISIAALSFLDPYGWLLLTYFITIWSVDIFAMIFGKNIGGRKLAPITSPNKTISGFIGGIVSAVVIVYLLQFLPFYQLPDFYESQSKISVLLCFSLIAIISQYSDLFVSLFKRKFNLKDSGNIIPGHGGVLDRFDSFLLTAPIIALWSMIKYLNFYHIML
jgi:phosphatidate cytidylyltransferase